VNGAIKAHGGTMKVKEIIAIYLKSGIPVIIVFTVVLTISYIKYSEDEILVNLYALIFYTLCYYVLFLLIGFPLLALSHKFEIDNIITVPLLGFLIGFFMMAYFNDFRFTIIRKWFVYSIFSGAGLLSGFYVHWLLKKKKESLETRRP
jgi:hypothetical protein